MSFGCLFQRVTKDNAGSGESMTKVYSLGGFSFWEPKPLDYGSAIQTSIPDSPREPSLTHLQHNKAEHTFTCLISPTWCGYFLCSNICSCLQHGNVQHMLWAWFTCKVGFMGVTELSFTSLPTILLVLWFGGKWLQWAGLKALFSPHPLIFMPLL